MNVVFFTIEYTISSQVLRIEAVVLSKWYTYPLGYPMIVLKNNFRFLMYNDYCTHYLPLKKLILVKFNCNAVKCLHVINKKRYMPLL